MPAKKPKSIKRRTLCIHQNAATPLYLLTMTAEEILRIADISRISRNDAGDLIGYQRSGVKAHVEQIVEYLDSDNVLFPNSIIIALPSTVRFTSSRGRAVDDGLAVTGTLEIPLPAEGGTKPGWIVDGQQRALALAQAKRQDFPVPISAFVADNVGLQREQFLRINNTKPLPRGLVAELLPEVDTVLPPRLSARKMPSKLCEYLNSEPSSPFYGMVRRASSNREERKKAVISDTPLIKMLEESITSTSGCLFPYRNIATGETEFDGIVDVLTCYWSAVRTVFPEAWGKGPTRSRLMHGAGIRAMGRLMDKVMANYEPGMKGGRKAIEKELLLIEPYCHWTKGAWDDLGGLKWNEVQNVPRHIAILSNYLVRTYVEVRRGHR